MSYELTRNEPILIILQPVCKKNGDPRSMPFFIPRSRSNILKVANVMSLPVMPKIVRERGRIPVSCDGSWIRKTKLLLKHSVCTPSNVGVKKLGRFTVAQLRPNLAIDFSPNFSKVVEPSWASDCETPFDLLPTFQQTL